MPRLPALDPADAGGAQDPLVRTLAASPQIGLAAAQHARLVMQAGTVPPLTKALTAMMVAAVNFCNPSVIAHRREARRLGADAQMLNEIWDYARSERYTPAQRAALAAAVAVTREPRGLPEAVWTKLRENYDDAQIVELLCVIGMGNYLDRISNALQTEIGRED